MYFLFTLSLKNTLRLLKQDSHLYYILLKLFFPRPVITYSPNFKVLLFLNPSAKHVLDLQRSNLIF